MIEQELQHVQPPGNGGRIGQRRRDAGRQEAAPRPGDRAVHGPEQAALAAAGQRLDEFEVAPRGGVDLHDRAGGQTAQRRQARQAALLGQLDVVDQGAGSGQLATGEIAEGLEGLDLKHLLEAAPRVDAVETCGGQGRKRGLPLAQHLEQLRPLQKALGQQQLAWLKPR